MTRTGSCTRARPLSKCTASGRGRCGGTRRHGLGRRGRKGQKVALTDLAPTVAAYVPTVHPEDEEAEDTGPARRAREQQQQQGQQQKRRSKKGGIVVQLSQGGVLGGGANLGTMSASRGGACNWAERVRGGDAPKPQKGPSFGVELLHPSPGIVLMRNIIPAAAQQHFMEVSIKIGMPTNGLSGGWFKIERDAEKTRRWNHGKWGQMHEPTNTFPPQYIQLHDYYLRLARQIDDELPDASPNLCLSNFYPRGGPGIYWHRDNSPNQKNAVRLGLPIVSFSFGDAAVFTYKNEEHDKDVDVVLRSGDVIVFGGPARKLLHKSGTPFQSVHGAHIKQVMPGRLNLTFREQDGVYGGKEGARNDRRRDDDEWR